MTDRGQQDLFEAFQQLLQQHFQSPSTPSPSPQPIRENATPRALQREVDLSIPQTGVDSTTLIGQLKEVMARSVDTTHPFFMNQMYGKPQFAAVIGDMVTTLLNTSMYTYEVAPMLTLVEKACINQLGHYIWGEFKEADGIFTPGGSISNMMAMALARSHAFPQTKVAGMQAIPSCSIFISAESHYSFQKGARFLGFGEESIIKIPTDTTGQMDLEVLEAAILIEKQKGRVPLMVVGTAGTTIAGQFDNLEGIAKIAKRYELWFHVDAVYGGCLLLSQQTASKLNGVAHADSVSWNLHKMLGIPLVCAVLLTKHPTILKDTFSIEANYLFHTDESDYDLGQKSLQCGRRVDALKLWLAWQAAGEQGFADRIDTMMERAEYLKKLILSCPYLELYQPPASPIVCFQFVPEGLEEDKRNEINLEIREQLFQEGEMLFNYAVVGEQILLRIVISNPEITHEQLETLVAKIRAKGRAINKAILDNALTLKKIKPLTVKKVG